MTLNRMQIIGNLGADPELRYTPNGKAVTAPARCRQRQPQGTGWRVDRGDPLVPRQRLGAGSRAAGRQLRKGNKIYAEGQLKAREYEARDGQTRTSLELAFARVVNLERRPRDEDGRPPAGGGAYDDAPPQVKPRGAEARSSAPGAEMDVDDIPF